MTNERVRVIIGKAENIQWFRDCFWADLPVLETETKRRLVTIMMRSDAGGSSYLIAPRLWITPPDQQEFSNDTEFVQTMEKTLDYLILEWDKDNQPELGNVLTST